MLQTRAGFDISSLDPTVKPSDDFFAYANGGWLAANPIPAELPRWGRFTALAEENTARLRDILEEKAGLDAPPGSPDRKLGDFWASGMDEKAIEAAGLDPIRPHLDRIASIASLDDLRAVVAWLHQMGVRAFFVFGATQDYKDTTRVIGEADQSGLGLPDRDYYFDEASRPIREAYVEHVRRMFALLGDPDPEHSAAVIMRLETGLAEASKTRIELRDPEANYHLMDHAALRLLTPSLGWEAYFAASHAPQIAEINVGQPRFFEALERMWTVEPLDDLKVYLRWHFVNSVARCLPAAFVDEDFDFKGRTLTGAEVNRPRWKRVVAETDSSLGELLGQAYVERWFPPEARARVEEMVSNLKAALREDLETLPWMGEETRRAAIEKMDAFTDKIGYPEKWKEYATLEIDRGPYVLNVLRARVFATLEDLEKIGKPVDRLEWHMTPQTVNAYYNPLMNEIVFPAGILQPPFFHAEADDAINYGAIGAVIGHEMTHGFDDQGCQFDPSGNLRNWWSEEDLERFKTRAAVIEKQFGRYEVDPGVFMKGGLVKGEAIADLGGLVLAWRAFLRARGGRLDGETIDGFTPAQRFFLGFAQVWATHLRPEFVRLMAATDPHPHPRYRVNGTLCNMTAFGEAWAVEEGRPMQLPEGEKASIW
jgi:predicted metalloendopeptidase